MDKTFVSRNEMPRADMPVLQSSGPSFMDRNWRPPPHKAMLRGEIETAFLRLRLCRWPPAASSRLVCSDTSSLIEMCLDQRPDTVVGRPGGVERPLGAMVYLPRGQALDVCARNSREINSIWGTFDPGRFADTHDVPEIERSGTLIDFSNPRIAAHMIRLSQELLTPGFCSALLADATMVAIAVEMGRHLLRPLRTRMAAPVAAQRIRAVQDRLHANVSSPDLAELAALCGVSPRHLTRVFKTATGKTLGQYIAEVRMAKAMQLLAGSNCSIKEIAAELGFSAVPAFYAAFHRGVGMTPRQYRIRTSLESR
jgi:AraC family transcriptional regulator